jgi:hypothetical protein
MGMDNTIYLSWKDISSTDEINNQVQLIMKYWKDATIRLSCKLAFLNNLFFHLAQFSLFSPSEYITLTPIRKCTSFSRPHNPRHTFPSPILRYIGTRPIFFYANQQHSIATVLNNKFFRKNVLINNQCRKQDSKHRPLGPVHLTVCSILLC